MDRRVVLFARGSLFCRFRKGSIFSVILNSRGIPPYGYIRGRRDVDSIVFTANPLQEFFSGNSEICRHKKDGKVDQHQGKAGRQPVTRPFPAGDSHFARSDNIGNVAGDQHPSGNQKPQ